MSIRVFLGRYETIRLLGEGGMGRVYLAKQIDLGRQVVVKVMHDHVAIDPKFQERFQRETLLMAQFQHPFVVSLFDASLNDPQGPCIVMEYVKGEGLDKLLERNERLSPPRVGNLLGQLCEALNAAHAEGIIHRDLKPSNIMVVDPDTPYEKIKVMDFGLAKMIKSNSPFAQAHQKTETGADFCVGTPGYISPEQVRGDTVDYRCDIYSVGVILYELLTGRLPFTGNDTMDVLFAHATEPPPTFSELGADRWVSAEVEEVVMRCLAKEPKDRPASTRDLAREFSKALLAENTLDSHDAGPGNGPSRAKEEPTSPTTRIMSTTTGMRDPQAIVLHMEAWMPDSVAAYKLRGFMADLGTEMLENKAGRIRVRLENGGLQASTFSWFGLGKSLPDIDLELHLDRNNPQQPSQLMITVRMTSSNRKAIHSEAWRNRCNEIYCELRNYLAAATVSV